MSGWGVSDKATGIEKLKADFNDHIMGLNSYCMIDYSAYCELFDFTLPLIQKAYDLGKSESLESFRVSLSDIRKDACALSDIHNALYEGFNPPRDIIQIVDKLTKETK